MNYLHSLQPPVIHSDLKSKNVLISEHLVAKVSQLLKCALSYSCLVVAADACLAGVIACECRERRSQTVGGAEAHFVESLPGSLYWRPHTVL